MALQYTEHHGAEPVGDPIVYRAKQLCRLAMQALDKGNGYNAKGISYHDYSPHGVQDQLRCILEPVVRAGASGKPDQYRDAVGYVALFMAWVAEGMPESQFAPLMRKYYFDFYKLLKESDRTTGVQLPNPDWQSNDGVANG